MKQRISKITINLSIDYDDGVVFFLHTLFHRLVSFECYIWSRCTYCERAHTNRIGQTSKRTKKLTHQMTHAHNNSIGIFFLVHSTSFMFRLWFTLHIDGDPFCGHHNEKLSSDKLQSMISAHATFMFIIYTGIRLESERSLDACGLIWFINTTTSIFNLVILK